MLWKAEPWEGEMVSGYKQLAHRSDNLVSYNPWWKERTNSWKLSSDVQIPPTHPQTHHTQRISTSLKGKKCSSRYKESLKCYSPAPSLSFFILPLKKKALFLYLTCVYLLPAWPHSCGSLLRPEEGIGSLGTGVNRLLMCKTSESL